MWREPALVVWALYLLLVPLYVFKSGLPQPGDALVLAVIPMGLVGWNRRLPTLARGAFRSLLWFTLWVCFVDYTWAFVDGNFGLFGMDTFILVPVYYIYNSLIFLVTLVLYRRYGDQFLKVTLYSIMATVAIQCAASLVLPSGTRNTVFFNNPNQLGYFALICGCIIALTHHHVKLRLWISGLALMGCTYLALLSASRAAAGGIAILFALLVFANPKIVIAASIVAVALFAFGGPVLDAYDSTQNRVQNRHSDATFLEERGYERIRLHKEYLVFGAGEGGLERFDDPGIVHNMEIHSSAGTILFSYGAVGCVFFLLFTWQVIRRARFRASLVLVPPLLYTVAHQGLRFTMLWVMLALFVALKEPVSKTP